jgi:glycosyltransferase involved in cell wall biosynthesis
MAGDGRMRVEWAHRADDQGGARFSRRSGLDAHKEDAQLKPHLLLVGGEEHALRIPFMLALRDHGFRASAATTGDPDPFARAGLDYYHFRFERFVNPLADWAAIKTISRLLLEAALAGLPIVTTRMPGCVDVVRDGWNGYLVPPPAPRILAARILDLLRDREAARIVGARATALVRREFGLGLTVARYAALYGELMGRSDRRRFQTTKDTQECEPLSREAC